MRSARRSPPPCVCCELATFAVLWKLARRHHQEITLSCSRQPRRRPQPAAHSKLDTEMQHGRGPKHVACQVKHTQQKEKKKKRVGCLTQRTAPPPSSARLGSAGHSHPSRVARTHATGDQTDSELWAAETTRHWPSAKTACCALIVAAASLRTSPTTPRRVRRATTALALTGCLQLVWPPAPGTGKLVSELRLCCSPACKHLASAGVAQHAGARGSPSTWPELTRNLRPRPCSPGRQETLRLRKVIVTFSVVASPPLLVRFHAALTFHTP